MWRDVRLGWMRSSRKIRRLGPAPHMTMLELSGQQDW